MYYVHDLETDKIHIFTGGKANWMKLPEAKRKEIARFCLFSRSRECWMSKAKAGGCYFLLKTLAELNFENRGKEGERLTIEERIEQKQEKAEARADRYEARADKAEAVSAACFKTSHAMMDAIPFGQPILLNHYSEQRDRNYRERAWNKLGKAVEASEKAKYYAGRASTARATAEGSQYSNPRYLGNRIDECNTRVREIQRALDGKCYVYSDPQPISDERRQRLQEQMDIVSEELGFYQHCLDTCGKTVYDKPTLKQFKEVKIRGRWEPIIRLNIKTVSVPNMCFQTEESQRKWPMLYPYTEVQEAR